MGLDLLMRFTADVTEQYIKQLVIRLNGERASSMSKHYVECIKSVFSIAVKPSD
jgi:hypothetical protein